MFSFGKRSLSNIFLGLILCTNLNLAVAGGYDPEHPDTPVTETTTTSSQNTAETAQASGSIDQETQKETSGVSNNTPTTTADGKSNISKAEPPKPTETIQSTQINNADNTWLMISAILVLLMTLPGLALFYAGMSRKKNVISTSAQVFAAAILVSVLWFMIGYTVAFSTGTPYLGGFDKAFLSGVIYINGGETTIHPLAPTVPELSYFMFQMTFAIITPALIVGAYVERVKFSAMLVFTAAWSLLVYAPIAHWVWASNGWIAQMGALDFAGGLVVHLNSGLAGLVMALVVGKRAGYGTEPMHPANLVLTMTGAALLWVGWFGFNAGSAIVSDGRSSIAMVNTQLGACFAAVSWMAVEWFKRRRPSLLGLCSGIVAGLVAITPAAGFVDPMGAMYIGLATGAVCYVFCTVVKKHFGYDDSLDAFGIHGVAGFIGSILTAVFANPLIGKANGDVVVQTIATLSVGAYTIIATLLIALVIKYTIGFRFEENRENKGLDIVNHGERIE